MASELKLPKLTETVDTVQINEILVSPGEVVEKDQPLMVVNADKSNMEIYAPMAGKIVNLTVKVGQEIKVGSTYALLEGGNGSTAAASPKQAQQPASPAPRTDKDSEAAESPEHDEEPAAHEVKAIRAD